MNKEQKYGYWLMLSDYDLDTIDCLIQGERWVYVAYLCQQAVERQLKGMYVYYTNAEAPKTHNLNFLFKKVTESEKFRQSVDAEHFAQHRGEAEDFLIDLMFYYMSDYPFSYKNISSRFVGKDLALQLYAKARATVEWLRAFQPETAIPRMDEK
ncbi:MAG: HEPN domain-containing protein [Clostridia bacterium]|nr:HEPN domain-containing protein [Clostridia bacterium]